MMRCLALGLLTLAVACAQADPGRIRVEQGEAQGVVRDGVRIFRSLPYAAAPVGALRFRAPQPAPDWDGVRDATAPGPLCTQNTEGAAWGPWTGALAPSGPVSEDCLTLSVWTPAQAAGEQLPVMVWIPGGGFTDGGEAMRVYDGEALARRGIVVVSINYRLNAFGLLTHPALEVEADGARGNYLLRDALAALGWVNRNIAIFGGDPERVTIAGQSAGGAIAYALLDAPQASGLFAGAILQSFPPGSHTLPDRPTAEENGRAAAASINAESAQALRAAPAEQLLGLHDGLDLHVDGVLISNTTLAAPPYVNDVPIMAGITADELSFLSPDLARYRREADTHGDGYVALYRADDDVSGADAYLRANRERAMVGLERWARATQGGAPLYLYLWGHAPPGEEASTYRAFHSSEVMYMFGALDAAPERGFTDEDRAISERMLDHWANFVKRGDPNGTGSALWPRADVDAPVFMDLGGGFTPLAPLPEPVRTFWNARFDAENAYRF
ncbi:MAG: carboxylesterase/lipase family protein [Hyphomonadaceae bacterium]